MTAHNTITKTVTVQNTEHLDEVTVHVEMDVACTCSSGLGGSYTRSDFGHR
ncbi:MULTISPECIES: hypothetical protein [unclassified Arthrobacter]|uniref:hypothetical protein n=1 Tax=unclassified Arthrobacter TaxID=235627 RepID=UPI00149227C8|nr:MULTISPECIES: hypothetical protein [unclassified Arthrobacter]NOJ64084.1 hypothetical protein [Arthrobacter sp. 147(2020)]